MEQSTCFTLSTDRSSPMHKSAKTEKSIIWAQGRELYMPHNFEAPGSIPVYLIASLVLPGMILVSKHITIQSG